MMVISLFVSWYVKLLIFNNINYWLIFIKTRAVIGETKARQRHVLSDMQREQESQEWPGKKRQVIF